MGRAAYGRIAALLLLSALLAGCGGDGAIPTPSPAATGQPRPTASATPTPIPPPPLEEEPPDRDLIDLARRYRGLPPPPAPRPSPVDLRIGDAEQFTILDIDEPALRTITASVRLITDHAYFFVEEGVEVSAAALQTVGADFETVVYPRVTAAFGQEWSPGVDGDRRISIVHAALRGALGYFSSSDEYPRSVVPRSNEREAVYLDTSSLKSPGLAYNTLLAHELQHLIHWNADGGEDAWVNEGLSQVAAELVGGGTDAIRSFLARPDTQLNHWPRDDLDVHYQESHLFFRYLLDRFGGRENAAKLLAVPQDGLAGVDAYLQEFDATVEDVFADWLAANYLDEDSGPYAHAGADPGAPAVTKIERPGQGDDSVRQFAADYLEVQPPAGGGRFSFDGSDRVGIDIPPQDGGFWWSNAGDDIDSRLTREFDLSGVTSATLSFRTWFDTERGWDYAYVAASRDGGKTWRALPGDHTTDYDPVALAYGPGYTGSSEEGWLQEEIDLTPFAGDEVLIRFEYVTDDAAHLRGFAVDDIAIPEIGFADAVDAAGGWRPEGFRLFNGPSEQRFLLQLIQRGEPAVVRRLELGPGNRLEIDVTSPATVVVAAVTSGTTEAAGYSWSLRAR